MIVGFIGCGNMGGALAKSISSNLETKVYICDNNKEKSEKFAQEIGAKCVDNITAASESDLLFIGVKPHLVETVARDIKGSISGDCVIVSMAAGVTTESLTEYFGKDKKIIRIMPNTPVKVGCGMTTYCCSALVDERDEEIFAEIMKPTGMLDKLPEGLIDAACAVAGCGPAFVYMFIESLADGAVSCGLPRDKATVYAAETLIGAAKMVIETGEHPEALKDAVCSPGGSTIEGVHALEDGAFRSSVLNAIVAAYNKTKILGKK